ncbi:MAG TPA: glycosyltransferase [Polyangiaceae bacterium]|jgi:rhamnosyl/mannosyltransferase
MHVVHVGKYYSPYRGGIETVVEQLSRGMVRHGLQVSVVVSNDARSSVTETRDGVRVIRLARAAVVKSQPLNLRLVATLRELRCDLLHFHTPNPIGALGVLAARPRQPIVVSHHSDIVRQRFLRRLGTEVQSMLYGRAACIVAATPRHVEYSPLLQRHLERCRVIHYPIDASLYSSAPGDADQELPDAFRSRGFALFVGRLVYYKGVAVLLEAMAVAPNARLVVVGSGPLEGALIAQARALGLEKRVIFLGEVSELLLRALYQCSRFLILPSVEPSEAFGMVQLEAMASGRAVVSTDLRSGVPYVNQHEHTGLVVAPRDVAALAAAIRKFFDDPDYCSRLGQNAVERVRREFDLGQVVSQHASLYEEVCGRHALGGRAS